MTEPSLNLQSALQKVTQDLLTQLQPNGHWTGQLSSSALSTATAVIALTAVDSTRHATLIQRGLSWLSRNANADGGWGDTIRSQSNQSTTALAWAAFGIAQADDKFATCVTNATQWLTRKAGSLQNLVPSIEQAYGKDRTFSVPITMTLALSGRLGPQGWKHVHPLPFELGALPPRLFGALRLPVVSYALPALIAIGQVIHHFAPTTNPILRLIRNRTRRKTLQRLIKLQPPNGGFLEATPLTSFVTMSLAAMGLRNHPVLLKGASFLKDSVQPDGSWPIDTNLATWGTTLSIKALAHQSEILSSIHTQPTLDWLLHQQYRHTHPYTQAAPGGWAWTDLPGGVPDADDTAGALLALRVLSNKHPDPRIPDAAQAGVCWLLNLQNRDGGIPTFCRGWGTLPFDQSTPELTAHALRAWDAWFPQLPENLQQRIRQSTTRAYRYLQKAQQPSGAWLPLWFGNETAPEQHNPVYGTAQVLKALVPPLPHLPPPPANLALPAVQFLLSTQHPNGGWGGNHNVPPTIEETALAAEALSAIPSAVDATSNGLEWVANAIQNNQHHTPSPIGLYFARLWYSEQLYPLVFATSALAHNPIAKPPDTP
ncbi:MAG: prenyltransferase/squalene oxidase repeat-containing protein [Limisphaerales bacterium]